MIPNAIHDRLSTDNRGVSPVIGVILMVAITVILAAVIGTFVLDLGQEAGNNAPSASLTVSADTANDNITISHKGGDSLADEFTRITITNESSDTTLTFDPGTSNDVFGVGNQVVLNLDASPATVSGSSDAFTARNEASSSNFPGVASGTQYSVQVIDTESQRVIFETKITA